MSLFLKTAKFKNGKTYLSIVDGYRSNGKVKQKVYKKLAYLDDLKRIYDDPIFHFKQEVENLKKYFLLKLLLLLTQTQIMILKMILLT